MSLTLKIGATLTGGTDLVFNDSGRGAAGEREFAATTSTILEPRVIKVKSTIPVTTSANPGTSRSEVRFILGSRVESATCCDVKSGTVLGTITTAWPLSQPSTLADELIDEIRAFVHTDAFVSLIKNGTIPQ